MCKKYTANCHQIGGIVNQHVSFFNPDEQYAFALNQTIVYRSSDGRKPYKNVLQIHHTFQSLKKASVIVMAIIIPNGSQYYSLAVFGLQAFNAARVPSANAYV
jgi:hypothetical protein